MDVSAQLSVELTTLFGPPVIRKGLEGVSAVFDWIRKLRQCGSDAIVDIDLAEILGRGRIEPVVEANFRSAVMQPFTITPIQHGAKLELSKGTGPTLLWKENPYYDRLFSSVVQLSFLGSIYDRTSLATTLTECLEARHEKGLSKWQSPGFDGIFRTLQVCSSETSGFRWSDYIESAKLKLSRLIPLGSINYHRDALELSPDILLGCLDFLYIVQRTPEERLMRVNGSGGVVALIVWAHHILGISMLVVKGGDSSDQVEFINPARPEPAIIVNVPGSESAGKASERLHNACVYSKDNELLYSTDAEHLNTQKMETRERLQLRGYGTITLCRLLDESVDTFIREPKTAHLTDAAEFIIAMACLISSRLLRKQISKDAKPIPVRKVKPSLIYDAASLLFGHPYSSRREDRLPYSEGAAEKCFQMMQKYQAWDEMPMPPALSRRLQRMSGAGMEDFCELATTLTCLAMTLNIGKCAEMKLVAADECSGLTLEVRYTNGNMELAPHDIFSHMCRLLVGSDLFFGRGNHDVFMVSEFGWTISLPVYGDIDPSIVIPEFICVYEGTPTNSKTLERKSRVRDGEGSPFELTPAGEHEPLFDPASDRGVPSYKPRCISPVQRRTEYLGSRPDGFHLSVKITGVHTEHFVSNGDKPLFYGIHRYRGLHQAIWGAHTAPDCAHPQNSEEDAGEATLGMGVVTAAGIWAWGLRSISEDSLLPERLVVVLVRGDKRARWLAVAATLSPGHGRQTMLRGSRSCENCALQAAADLPGRWAIII